MRYSVGYLTSKDPENRNAWSGTMYQMLKSLREQDIEVKILGPLSTPRIICELLTFINYLTRLFFKKEYNHRSNLLLSLLWKFKIHKLIKLHRPDLIFAPIASTEIAFLKTDLPICYLSDSSFAQLNGYYPRFSNFSQLSNRETNYLESRSLTKATSLVYPSRWAGDFVVDNYGINPQKIKVIKFGANLSMLPDSFIRKNMEGKFNLLFLGVDWERKGGPLVFKTFEILIARGLEVSLTICGCTPNIRHPEVKIIPFLDKNKPEDESVFAALLNRTHLLILPTRAECFGIVFSEASAFGVPSITTQTGGVVSAVADGENGYLLPMDAGPEDYALVIDRLIQNRDEYLRLSEKSRIRYEAEQNWTHWGKEMKQVFDQMVNQNK